MKKETIANLLGLAFVILFIIAVAFSTKEITAISIAQQTKCWNAPYKNLVLNYTKTLLNSKNLTNSVQNLTIEYCNILLAGK